MSSREAGARLPRAPSNAARPSWRPLIPLFLVMVILAAAGLSLSGHYGFSTDETREMDMVQYNYDHLTKGIPMNGNSEFYGPVFNIPAEVGFLGVRKIRRWLGHEPGVPADPNDAYYRRYRDRMGAKHAMTFLVSLLAYGAVAWIVAIWCGWGYAWLGPVTMPPCRASGGTASSTPRISPSPPG